MADFTMPLTYDLVAHLRQQAPWSERTFGPGMRTAGVSDHIRKELAEIAAAPGDLSEWVDVILLALDGAWRAGYSAEQIALGLAEKLERNMRRQWPDWRQQDPDRAIEHIGGDEPRPPSPAYVAAAVTLAEADAAYDVDSHDALSPESRALLAHYRAAREAFLRLYRERYPEKAEPQGGG